MNFMDKLSHLLGSTYSQFFTLNSVEKTSFVMGSELWEEDFNSLLIFFYRANFNSFLQLPTEEN